jgi:spermidine/putrescine transport system ATP-binding protein
MAPKVKPTAAPEGGATEPTGKDDRGFVEIVDLCKRFDDVEAVRGISLEIGEGEFFSLLGPSGCGKTTTLRMVGGFERPDSGQIRLGAEAITEMPPHNRPVNTVFQSYALFPFLSVEDNIAFGFRFSKASKDEVRSRVAEMIELTQLQGMEHRHPHQLSGGQQQRAALARALSLRPKVLLLDEPLGALDAKLRRSLQVELKDLQRRVGTTFIYVTHDQEEALTMSDRIAVMEDGRVQQLTDPRTLYERPATSFVADFIGTSNSIELEVSRRDGELALMELGDGMRIVAHDPGGTAAALMITVRPEKIKIGSADIEGGSRISGEVVEQVYLGSLSQTLVELPTGDRLAVHQLNDDEASTAALGDRVELNWAAHHSLVVAPAEALLEAAENAAPGTSA